MWRCLFITIVGVFVFWIYILTVYRNNFVANTSIELNFIGGHDIANVNNCISDYNSGVQYEGNKSAKRKIKHHVPKFMLDLYENSVKVENNENTSFPDIVKSVIPRASGTFDEATFIHDFEDNHLLIFDIPPINEDEIFLTAELKILTIIQIETDALEGVERFLKISVYDDTTQKMFFVDKLQVYHTNNTWISFNVTTPVHDLISNRKADNYSLKIIISIKSFLPYMENTSGNFKLSLLPVEEDFEHDYPILLLSYSSVKDTRAKNKSNKDSSHKYRKRTRRNIEEDYEEATNRIWSGDELGRHVQTRKVKKLRNTCKRKSLYIDFAEIDYDSWIVQPAGYEAYQCQGKCFYPVADHLTPTKHAILQALLHNLQPMKAVRSCCVPTSLDSISILYIDRGVLTYRFAYKDMVVLECGCR